jgi:hypothetical protein
MPATPPRLPDARSAASEMLRGCRFIATQPACETTRRVAGVALTAVISDATASAPPWSQGSASGSFSCGSPLEPPSASITKARP